MSDRYILDENGEPSPEPDLHKWGQWLQKSNRHLANDKLENGIRISTVFLGLDHSFGDGPPILWETMIFGGKHDQYQDRYAHRESALKGHKYALALAKGEIERET